MAAVINKELSNQEKIVKAFESVEETKLLGEEITTAEYVNRFSNLFYLGWHFSRSTLNYFTRLSVTTYSSLTLIKMIGKCHF